MRFNGSRSSTAIGQFGWMLAYNGIPAISGLPMRKGAMRPEPSTAFVLPVRQDFIRDPRIMPGTTRMLMLIAGWSGRERDIFTTLGTLADKLGRSIRQVQRYIKDAAEEGYLYYGYRKDRLGYITGLKIRLNPSSIFAPKRCLPKSKSRQKVEEGAENRATTFESDTNGKTIFNRADIGDWERSLMGMMERNGIEYTIRE